MELWDTVEPPAARRLVAGAVDLFAERGFGGASTRDIAAAAGLSPGAMYVHFPSKAELLARIVLIVHEAALQAVSAAAAQADAPAARLRALVYTLARFHAAHQRGCRVVQNELGALAPDDWARIRVERRRVEALFRDEVAAGVAAGVFEAADVAGTARAIVSMCVDVARWYRPGGPDSPEDVGALYAHLALRMVRALP
ncbi:TetR family transcriptional regulator [Herbidospora sp. NEAU-GS84]|uniref:TetR family transcriptional regulator n=1 Tax=Herbidospora solisilvae TaxID=2696284 RepID=A0A7C9NJP5_9ACTN|nr:TetR/AcrR family transcriptional regulator [Herbidospora solisilvae]NAS20196.1 TetR family transcriptional regulator [Herbidospora solisilvae]